MSLSWRTFADSSEIFSSRCCKRTKCVETQTPALTRYLPWGRDGIGTVRKGDFFCHSFKVALGASQRHLLREVQIGSMAEFLSSR